MCSSTKAFVIEDTPRAMKQETPEKTPDQKRYSKEYMVISKQKELKMTIQSLVHSY